MKQSDPNIDLLGRDFLSVANLAGDEIEAVLELGLAFKQGKLEPAAQRQIAVGQTLALVFDKASLRTRVSFEVAIRNLGGHAIYLAPGDIRMGEREPVKDVARTLSRMVQAVTARISSDAVMEELAQWASIPIVNAQTDREHPCQALADMLTVKEHKPALEGLKLGYIGDGFNVCQSLMLICALLGIDIAVASPPGYEPQPEILEKARALAHQSGVEVVNDPDIAARGADVLCADVWTSAGLEAEAAKRRQDFAGFQLDGKRLSIAKKDAIVLHCLPAHRGEEITDEVIEGPQSVVFDEAENRLWAQQALLALILGPPGERTAKRGK
ncbi:MAG: ornithine carbamoyltransferase [Armatimonadetes bacterium]|nr:ornithine carbamoyltransferase [Armatimonadota bacterium]NIM23390.1 ornithine carbamoyltransferase [Armatimonadota bacterium]NIM67255.1 ornithine carbamoyltransferase [Armatimonadota bacterium]NIM75753.1 ornithine carbamoyltransferase [Armatimonadota bacterium]NIN05441.1 ornithine carbamoyltransferase [Armatimonadota bacterium]